MSDRTQEQRGNNICQSTTIINPPRSEIPPTKPGLAQVLLPKPLPRTRDWPAEGQQPHLETPLGRRWDAAGWMGCDTTGLTGLGYGFWS
ncbi:hypothetical protein E4U52_000462 [Claviceps spartinae]|nr:hypothetical protein E4U52_000462 [Claviceps spartinae]